MSGLSDVDPTGSGHLDGVLVVGGGYAGVHAAQAAQRMGARVTVLDPTGDYDFVPRLAAVAGGTAPVTDASAPLAELVDHVRLGSITATGDGGVRLADGLELTADAVVVTAGAVPGTPPIDGIEHTWPLRSAADAVALRHAVDGADSLVVVGGGATGVQLAGAAAVRHEGLRVHLVEADARLLGAMGTLSDDVQRILEARGVEVTVGAAVEAIDAGGVELDSGRRLDGVVAWAAGFDARADALGAPSNDAGRIEVGDDLRIEGMDRSFAAGDIAAHRDEDGEALAMSAQIAVQAGRLAGRNAARLVVGMSTEPVALSHRGWVLDLGGGRGVAQIGPFALGMSPTDRLAPLLHLAVDLKHLHEVGGVGAIRSFRPGASRHETTADPDDALAVLEAG